MSKKNERTSVKKIITEVKKDPKIEVAEDPGIHRTHEEQKNTSPIPVPGIHRSM